MRYVKQNKIYTIQEIRQENPNMSIPADADCSGLGFEFLEEVKAPVQDGFYAVEVAPINNKQTWELIPIQVIVPGHVTMRQARLYLLSKGLLNMVDSIVSQNEAWKIEWEYATDVVKNSPLVSALASELNLSAEDIDVMFSEASLL